MSSASQNRKALRARAVHVARGLVGVMEHGGNNRGTIVEKIIHANGGVTGEPWCGDFVAYCYKLAGSKTVERSWASVRLLGHLTGQLIVGKDKGRAGDIVTYTFDHTGMLLHYTSATGTIVPVHRATHVQTVEGNTGTVGAVSDSTTGGDGVYIKIRPLSQVDRIVRVLR